MLCQCARLIANLRTRAHDGNRKPDADLGAGNANADYFGALAEVAVLSCLERHELKPHGYTLYAPFPPTGPDFWIEKTRYGIKAVPPGKSFLCINERQRRDPSHAVNYYLPAVFQSPETIALFRPIPAQTVASWPLRYAHSAYRSCPVADLQPIRSPREVAL